jgi:D-tyrosyl-tRNA(Tyr) deacylase
MSEPRKSGVYSCLRVTSFASAEGALLIIFQNSYYHLQYSMKLVIQRVNNASVMTTNNQRVVGKIEKGLFVLFGVKKGDTEETAVKLAKKTANLRIFSDKTGKMQDSALDQKNSILVVSQFTLNSDTKRGQRPSFIDAEEPRKAEKLYLEFISTLKSFGLDIQTGKFGEYMKINAEFDGPVTILIEE